MNFILDRNRLYLVLLYLLLSFLYFRLVLSKVQDPALLMACLLALVFFVSTSHEVLLRVISQFTGRLGTSSELQYYSAFIELTRKLHNFMEAGAVLSLVDETLREKVQVRRAIYLLGRDLVGHQAAGSDTEVLELQSWPDLRAYYFHGREFEREVLKRARVLSLIDAPAIIQQAFAETGTSLLVPIVQQDRLLGVMLLGRSDHSRPYSIIEYHMFGFLADQLSIIFDRLRAYAKVMQKTAMDHAEKMQVMQSLSANIAHEMRTPLSGIRASITGIEEYLPQLLSSHDYSKKQAPERFPPIRENHLMTLLGTPRRIKLMIDQANTVIDMLLMNLRNNALDRKQFNPCSAAMIVEQAVDRYPFRSGEREKLFLDMDKDFQFLGIESLFTYILFNLLKNAFYSLQSAQKGDISIRLERNEHEGRLVFRDTGLGIDPQIVDRIFEGFFTTKSDGTGAGLAFCRRTVHSFDGDIECRSVLGEYAEFIIRLPRYHGPS
jgi:signal transduction histidine kinase